MCAKYLILGFFENLFCVLKFESRHRGTGKFGTRQALVTRRLQKSKLGSGQLLSCLQEKNSYCTIANRNIIYIGQGDYLSSLGQPAISGVLCVLQLRRTVPTTSCQSYEVPSQ